MRTHRRNHTGETILSVQTTDALTSVKLFVNSTGTGWVCQSYPLWMCHDAAHKTSKRGVHWCRQSGRHAERCHGQIMCQNGAEFGRGTTWFQRDGHRRCPPSNVKPSGDIIVNLNEPEMVDKANSAWECGPIQTVRVYCGFTPNDNSHLFFKGVDGRFKII